MDFPNYYTAAVLVRKGELLDGDGPMGRPVAIGCYAVAAMPLPQAWAPYCPKVWGY